MKIAVISDIHLGRKNFRKASKFINDIERIGYEQWFKFINDIINNNPDIFIITGDLFHSSNPSSITINKAKEGFDLLEKNNIKTYIIAGNHEYSRLNDNMKTHLFKIFENTYKNIKFIYNNYEKLIFNNSLFYFIPHYSLHINKENKIEKEKYINMLSEIVEDKKKSNIKESFVFSHGLIESWINRFIKNEKFQEELIYLNTTVYPDWFANNFNYFILGHIHNSFNQKFKTDNENTTIRISPGSSMEDNEGSFKIDIEKESVGPLYLISNDENNNEKINNLSLIMEDKKYNIYRSNISSVKIINKIIENKDDLINLLKNIEFNIYIIKYIGEWKDIPSELYKEAIINSLYLNIKVEDIFIYKNKEINSIKTFWEWANDNLDKNLILEMKNIVKEEI